jgi:hypothetical protein
MKEIPLRALCALCGSVWIAASVSVFAAAKDPTANTATILPPSNWETPTGAVDPNRAFLRDASNRREMPFTRPNLRAIDRSLNGVRYVLSLDQQGAKLRTFSSVPEIDLILPRNEDAKTLLALVMFGESRTTERKVQTGNNQKRFPQGLLAFRTIPMDIQTARDQSKAPEQFIVYRIKPAQQLDRGEYALLLAKGDSNTQEEFTYGPNEGFNVYDFAVE